MNLLSPYIRNHLIIRSNRLLLQPVNAIVQLKKDMENVKKEAQELEVNSFVLWTKIQPAATKYYIEKQGTTSLWKHAMK